MITDFTVGAGNDVLDVSDLLRNNTTGFDGSNPFTSGFIKLTQSGADTLVSFDPDGAAGAQTATVIAVLQNVHAADLVAANLSPGFIPEVNMPQGQTIVGTQASDVLTGGLGHDTLSGLGGADVFNYSQLLTWGPSGLDIVSDFADSASNAGNTVVLSAASSLASANGDVLQVNYAQLSALGGAAMGSFAHPDAAHYATLGAGDLVNGSAANASHAQFLYDSATGILAFDPDGVGTQVAIAVTTLGTSGHHPVAVTTEEIAVFGG